MEKYKMISRIASDFVNRDDFKDMPETIVSNKALDAALMELIGKETYIECIEPLLIDFQMANHEQGFIYGFIQGMQLATEIYSKPAAFTIR